MENTLKNYDIVVIPDVHGRTFWKHAIPFIENGTNVVFLGDYLDPYSHEGITPKIALGNFKEILGITKDKPNVTMLIGNHDLEYIIDDAPACRCDYDNFEEISDLFRTNLDGFHFGKQFRPDTATPPLTLSHAGIHYVWYQELRAELATVPELGEDKTEHGNDVQGFLGALDDWHKQTERGIGSLLFDQSVREILASPVKNIYIRLLNRVSQLRGGMNMCGSMIWADIHEFTGQEPLESFGFQVVGHTMQIRKEFTDKDKGHFKWVPGDPVGMITTGNCGILCIDCQHCYGISHNPEKNFYDIEQIDN